jgi:hypothetical protein
LANNYVFERIPSGNNLKGKGKLISPDNNYFMGEFIGSVKNGYGEIHYENGFSFKGYFANDKRVSFFRGNKNNQNRTGMARLWTRTVI